jgi:hypothetical protein
MASPATKRSAAIAVAGVGALFSAAAGAGGCGLIDLESFDSITFQLPERPYELNTDDPRWRLPSGYPPIAITCGPPAGLVADCCSPPPGGVPFSCGEYPLTCEGGTCAAKFTVEQVKSIDLGKEVVQLRALGGKILSSITLTRIHLEIKNGLNVALPEAHLYVAPAPTMSSAQAAARLIATIPPLPAGYQGSESITLTAEQQRAFSAVALDFRTPFKLIVSTTVVVRSGTPPPQGRLDLTLSGTAEARL